VPSHRKALKKIALGGTIAAGASALPPQWVKPIVDKVVVPAHAQTSPPPGTTQAPGTTAAPTTTAAPPTTPGAESAVELDNSSSVEVTVQYTNNAGSQSINVPAQELRNITAFLNSAITFTASSDISINWLCNGDNGQSAASSSHTLTVLSLDCAFLFL
jgi:hypothetical protein